MHAAGNCRHIASPFNLHLPSHLPKHPNFTSLTSSSATTTDILYPICCSEHKPTTNQPSKKSSMDGLKKPVNRNPRKSSYGSSRKSVLRKTFKQEQVTFTAPVSYDPVVAIIGGGMSGLVCALQLEKRGFRSTVFDTGIHGLGGRMATRTIDSPSLIFDHAAQFFTVSEPLFMELVDEWSNRGLVRQSLGIIGELEAGGVFTPLPSSPPRYVAVNGMRFLADSLISQDKILGKTIGSARMVDGLYFFDDLAFNKEAQCSMVNVVRPCWISSIEPYNGMWHLSENGKPRGRFDAIVIAHNGKCANRLLSSSGLPLIARQMKKLELSSIWALLAAFEYPLPMPSAVVSVPFEGAFVKGVDSVSWMGNNTQKLFGYQNGGIHCWTIFSTGAFGKQNKVPQENIPTATAEKVKRLMLAGVESALGCSNGFLQRPIYTRVQLWGAALPTNTPSVPCIFDPLGRAGICGDWLLGSSLEAAALSGMALANHIADYLQGGFARPDDFSVGLHNDFQPLSGHDIGQFPGLDSKKEICGDEVQLGA